MQCWPDKIRSKKSVHEAYSLFFFCLLEGVEGKGAKERGRGEEKYDCEQVLGEIQYISVRILLRDLRSFGFVSLDDGYSRSPQL